MMDELSRCLELLDNPRLQGAARVSIEARVKELRQTLDEETFMALTDEGQELRRVFDAQTAGMRRAP